MRQIPDISQYAEYRAEPDVSLEGRSVPGLTGRYYQRRDGDRWATIGHYSYDGEELFCAWGYRDEAHCAWTSYRDGGEWTVPHRGCPRLRWSDSELLIDTGRSPIRLPLDQGPSRRNTVVVPMLSARLAS